MTHGGPEAPTRPGHKGGTRAPHPPAPTQVGTGALGQLGGPRDPVLLQKEGALGLNLKTLVFCVFFSVP